MKNILQILRLGGHSGPLAVPDNQAKQIDQLISSGDLNALLCQEK